MCWCSPNVRTLNCGKPECVPPAHRHNREAGCEHATVKYCKTCDQPYCTDCGKAWNAVRLPNNSIDWYRQIQPNAQPQPYQITYTAEPSLPWQTTTICLHNS